MFYHLGGREAARSARSRCRGSSCRRYALWRAVQQAVRSAHTPKPSNHGNVSSASLLGWIVLFICLSEGDCRVEDHRLLKLDNNVEDLWEHGCVQETLLG